MKILMRLYQRENGIWYIRKTHSKRVSLGTRDAKVAARRFEAMQKAALAHKLVALSQGLEVRSLAAFTREYLEKAARIKRPASVRADSLALRKLMDFLGPDIFLSRITPRQLDLFLTCLHVKPISANTYLRHLKAAFNQAVDWGYLSIEGNPCRRLKAMPVEEEIPRELSPPELAAFFKAEVDPRFRLLWQFYLFSGCRRAEALQLQVTDLDWQNRRLVIRRTKNRRPLVLPLTPELETVLRQVPVAVGRLFPWGPDAVSHHFKKTARKAGLNCRLHDLRHTYITILVKAGVNALAIQWLAGHKDPKSTARYMHLNLDYLEKELEKTRHVD